MEAQIRRAFQKALRDRLVEVVEAPASAEDARWVVALLRELADRLRALTPRRVDMDDALAFDEALVEQMLRHGAADASDLKPFADAAVRRMGLLCAPVQDQSVSELARDLANAASGSEALGLLLCRGNEIVGDIERMVDIMVNERARRKK